MLCGCERRRCGGGGGRKMEGLSREEMESLKSCGEGEVRNDCVAICSKLLCGEGRYRQHTGEVLLLGGHLPLSCEVCMYFI